MPRFYLAPETRDRAPLKLTGAEAHHCLDVLRLKAGARIRVFNGAGTELDAEIVAARRDCVELRVLSERSSPPPACRITLAQAIPKGKNMEWIVEKATELGASAIVPLLTAHTVVQLDAADAARKQEKWQRVAVEAAKQCGRNWLPAVALPVAIKNFFAAQPAFDLALIGSLEKDAAAIKSVLAAAGPGRIGSALILIGPEGDFSPAEMLLAKEAGCRPITFGTAVLRSETAAFFSLSVLTHELSGEIPDA